jgi:SAM-dependent methyltransferase
MATLPTEEHWDAVYRTKASDAVSWYRPHLDVSLEFITRAVPDHSAAIIDVGAGESTLVDDLLTRGYNNLIALDISATALEVTRRRIGSSADRIQWIVADVTRAPVGRHCFDIWHDRAVFHFLIGEEDRAAYVRQVLDAVRPGGHVIMGTFGPEGPTRCSGLDVVRYDANALHQQFGERFQLLESAKEIHVTPWGAPQQFMYCWCRVE